MVKAKAEVKVRRSEPPVYNLTRGSTKLALSIASQPEWLAEAEARYQKDWKSVFHVIT